MCFQEYRNMFKLDGMVSDSNVRANKKWVAYKELAFNNHQCFPRDSLKETPKRKVLNIVCTICPKKVHKNPNFSQKIMEGKRRKEHKRKHNDINLKNDINLMKTKEFIVSNRRMIIAYLSK